MIDLIPRDRMTRDAATEQEYVIANTEHSDEYWSDRRGWVPLECADSYLWSELPEDIRDVGVLSVTAGPDKTCGPGGVTAEYLDGPCPNTRHDNVSAEVRPLY